MFLENFLALLQNVKKSGENWIARCPSHDDKHNSLSIGLGSDEKILIKCHAGCRGEEILQALGLSWKDLFPQTDFRKSYGITVADLAFSKGLPEEFLQNLGIEPKGNWLRIPYYQEDGTLASRQRKRWALSAKEGSAWEAGEGHPIPYGLWKLKEARKEGYLFLVEGESDCWTLWYHGYPALGLPGADMAEKIEARYLDQIKKIYIIQEPDQGGETFVRGIRKRLYKMEYKGMAFVVAMKGAKDPNDLHCSSSNFHEDFAQLVSDARPISLFEPKDITVDYGNLIPELPEPEDKTVLELMEKAVATQKNFFIIAPQGSGKSYSNSYIAVNELKKGRCVILSSRSHDELNQIGRTTRKLLKQIGMPEYHLFHLKGSKEREKTDAAFIPDVRPIIVLAPHAYFHFKGDTPYHYALADMLFQGEFGEKPLVLIDELNSFMESAFISKVLGSRKSLKRVFGEELWIKNRLCPLYTSSGNCLNCEGNMFLHPRSGEGGMLSYTTIFQRHKQDKLREEKVDVGKIVKWDIWYEENTMRVYDVFQPKTFEQRQWSTGSKDDLTLEMSFEYWRADVISRMIAPHIVYFYPYDIVKKENLGRSLTEQELDERKKGRQIALPHHVCGVPILQGWDLAVLRKLNGQVQIGLTAPGATNTERYILKQAIGLSTEHYSVASTPYIRFSNLLILILEKDLSFDEPEVKTLLEFWAQSTKIISFLPTYYDASQSESAISENTKTMYYDGAQKIRNAPIEGTCLHFDICISCIHGPLGQGLDLGQFKLAMVSTNCERPKCLFTGRPVTKTNKEYILEDVAEKSRQAALRILRLTEGESQEAPRVILFYGRYSYEVAHKVEAELSKVGHTVKVLNAKTCLQYAREVSIKWLAKEDISPLESQGVETYEEQEIIGKAQAAILEYQKEHPKADWREIVVGPRILRDLPRQYKDKIKKWFQENSNKNDQNDSLTELIEKIKKFLKQNPNTKWYQIYRKFNLVRKHKEEQIVIQQTIGV
ncbi:MAG: hypothetical protein HUU50_22025 [Candidatus Brocadiae bacterium]|nr:hypothetical protein [Candidatus Brocadiia bacterium]